MRRSSPSATEAGHLVYGEPRRRYLSGGVHPHSPLFLLCTMQKPAKVTTRPSSDTTPVSVFAMTIIAASESLPLNPLYAPHA
jgi:hypothetical protein